MVVLLRNKRVPAYSENLKSDLQTRVLVEIVFTTAGHFVYCILLSLKSGDAFRLERAGQ
jgi:hypothetical protein